MALLAEEIVEEWLNRQGYFTIRGVKVGGYYPPHWPRSIDQSMRITFEFIDGNAYIVNYEDYHQ